MKGGATFGARRYWLRYLVLFGSLVATALTAAQSGSAPAISIVEIAPRTVPLTVEYAARVTAAREVRVRAQAGGILLERSYVEGAFVNEGDLLFRIDPRPYEAELARVRAQLQQAEAELSHATREAARISRLAERGTASQQAKDDAVSGRERAAAAVAGAAAQVQLAELNLSYTTVTAPISGITSLEQVPEGSLVAATGEAGLLTTITQLDPVYVNFSVTGREFAEVRQLLESQGLWGQVREIITVRVMFGDGSFYSHTGVIDFASSSLNTETGTLRLRATLANPDRRLLPGQFVRALMSGITLPDALVIPRRALMQAPEGPFVYVVDAAGTAEVRPVKVGREVADGWVATAGLSVGDRVVAEGVVKIRPGQSVVGGPSAAGSAE